MRALLAAAASLSVSFAALAGATAVVGQDEATLPSLVDPMQDVCGPADAESRTIYIAHSVDVLDETQNAIRTAMQNRANAISEACPNLDVTYEGFDAQQSVDKQIADVDTIILKEPDVLIFSAVDTVGSLPAVDAANEAGIKVIDIRASLTGSDAVDVSFYASHEPSYSGGTVDWIKSYLEAHPDENLDIGLIYGAAAQTPQLIREDAIKDFAAEMPDRVTIVDWAHGDWLLAKAQEITDGWLLAHPEINYISAANDIMAQGVSNAIAAAGKTGEVMVSGYDVTDEGIQRIVDGTQDLDVGALVGDYAKAVDIGVGLTDGWFTDDSYTNTQVYVVTADNVQEFLATRMELMGY